MPVPHELLPFLPFSPHMSRLFIHHRVPSPPRFAYRPFPLSNLIHTSSERVHSTSVNVASCCERLALAFPPDQHCLTPLCIADRAAAEPWYNAFTMWEFIVHAQAYATLQPVLEKYRVYLLARASNPNLVSESHLRFHYYSLASSIPLNVPCLEQSSYKLSRTIASTSLVFLLEFMSSYIF